LLLAAAAFAAAGSLLAQTPEQQSPAQQSPAQPPPAEQPANPLTSLPTTPVVHKDKPYAVECKPPSDADTNGCMVDRNTYVGWRTFHSVCHTCHAQDAVGSTFAPSLVERLHYVDKATFEEVLNRGVKTQAGVMPAWGNNPNVNKYYEQLWSYLRARSDGALPPGRPGHLPESR
jgi:hypothetical protein